MAEIGKLAGGEAVVDRYNSHLHSGVSALLPEAVSHIDMAGQQFAVKVVDFGQIIGNTICVQTSEYDQIVFAQRPGRQGPSRFVKNRAPEPCSSLVVILKKAFEDNTYVLITAFIGHRPHPEPWDRAATPESVIFWQTHALVWGNDEIVPGSETTSIPW